MRGSIAIGESFAGDSIIGWSERRQAILLHFWSNGAPHGTMRLDYHGSRLIFTPLSDAPTARTEWTRVSETEIAVAPQTLEGGTWKSGAVVRYRRDGAAPAAFSAAEATAASAPSARFGWLADLAGRCWKGQYADGSGGDRQCYAAQYPNVMQAAAAIDAGARSPRGAAAYVAAGDALTVYYWSDGGHFGTASGVWRGADLVLTTDGDGAARSVWRRTGEGFSVARERLEDGEWRTIRAVDYRADGAR